MIKIRSVLFVCAISVLAFFSSCENPGQENQKTENIDSLILNNKLLEKSVGLFKEATLPFEVDTAFLFKIEKGDSLGGFEISTLAANLFKHDLINELEYDLKTFYHIDSIKAEGKYREYCDSLDIGMTKHSTAHALRETHLDPNTLILVWGLYTSSYEACPYSTTRSVYFTIIYKGDVKETFLLGEYVSAGDAPVSMERTVTGKLSADGTFMLNVEQINDQGDDAPKLEFKTEQYSFVIKNGIIKLLSEKKNPEKQIERKKKGA